MNIEKLVSPADFPAAEKSAYFNAASVALMYSETAKTILAWQEDVAYNGTLNFDEVAEEEIYKDLHIAAAEMLNAKPEDIAGGSSTTELMSSLAWSILPGKGTNIVSTVTAHPQQHLSLAACGAPDRQPDAHGGRGR